MLAGRCPSRRCDLRERSDGQLSRFSLCRECRSFADIIEVQLGDLTHSGCHCDVIGGVERGDDRVLLKKVKI